MHVASEEEEEAYSIPCEFIMFIYRISMHLTKLYNTLKTCNTLYFEVLRNSILL
jgi:hypothetical protein